MSREPKVASAAYRQIAIDIARDIAGGKYIKGQKLFGRSVLASQYKVSPETIRKAVYLLKEVGILDTEKGSGIEIKSVAEAKVFADRFSEIKNVNQTKNEILQWAQHQAKEAAEIIGKVQFIIDTSEKMKSISLLSPYEIKITEGSAAIGKTADELHFWHNTGGTIIAIRRGDELIISPGPYATFLENDYFYVVGNELAYAASIKLLFG